MSSASGYLLGYAHVSTLDQNEALRTTLYGRPAAPASSPTRPPASRSSDPAWTPRSTRSAPATPSWSGDSNDSGDPYGI